MICPCASLKPAFSERCGPALASRYPFEAAAIHRLSHDRSAVEVTIHIHGRDIHFKSTHLDADSTGYRLAEIGELMSWQRALSEPRVIAGDFNAWPGSSENAKMKGSYYDSWAEADGDGTALAYSANPEGNTRKSPSITFTTRAARQCCRSRRRRCSTLAIPAE